MNVVPRNLDIELTPYLPAGRVLSMDMLRGLAIVLMTVYHQGLIFTLDAPLKSASYFMGYLAAPFFLTVSGGSLWHHENRHRNSLKMVVHGLVLFVFAWSVDILAHQSLKVDWDIFQLIGIGYAVFGFLNALGGNGRKYVILVFAVGLMAFFPPLRPDKGVFAIWPYGAFFMIGYFFSHYLQSRLNRSFLTGCLLMALLGYVSFWTYAGMLPRINRLEGIVFAIGLCLPLWSTGLLLEYRKSLQTPIFRGLLRYGAYPLTLYYCQQITARFCMKFQISMPVFSFDAANWMTQSFLLLGVMLGFTFLLDRLKFLSIEWWLRKTENLILSLFSARTTAHIRNSSVRN